MTLMALGTSSVWFVGEVWVAPVGVGPAGPDHLEGIVER